MLVACLLCCAAVLWTTACGDDDKPPTGDSKVTKDTGPGADSSSGKDTGGTKKDAMPQDTTGKTWDGATNLSCGEIGLCNEDCGKTVCTMAVKFGCLMQCQTNCKAKGCASAKTPFETLSNCITKNCMMDCINGPGPKCTTCVTNKCSKETNACNAHTC
jgi:hypothetical protein